MKRFENTRLFSVLSPWINSLLTPISNIRTRLYMSWCSAALILTVIFFYLPDLVFTMVYTYINQNVNSFIFLVCFILYTFKMTALLWGSWYLVKQGLQFLGMNHFLRPLTVSMISCLLIGWSMLNLVPVIKSQSWFLLHSISIRQVIMLSYYLGVLWPTYSNYRGKNYFFERM
jgi:hypothetical protein